MSISAIVFDVDGTLYPWNQLSLQLAGTFLRKWRFFKNFYEVRKELRRQGKIERLKLLQVHMLAKRLRISEEEAQKRITWFVQYRLNKACSNIHVFPTLHEFIKLIKRLHIRVGVLSDFPIGQRLKNLGLGSFGELYMCSEDADALKPSPEPFLYVSKKLRISPQNILYIGDNYHYDIIGANRVGMQTAHLSKHPPRYSIATVTFSTYRVLGKWVQSNYNIIRPTHE